MTTKKKNKKLEIPKAETVIQFQGKEAELETIYARVKEAFAAEEPEETEINALKVYVKPEENAAYYVINDSFAGRVDLF